MNTVNITEFLKIRIKRRLTDASRNLLQSGIPRFLQWSVMAVMGDETTTPPISKITALNPIFDSTMSDNVNT